MNVVTINPKEKEESRRKADMVEILDYMKKQVEAGNLKEFVACSLDGDGVSQIHVSTLDMPGAVGLFEIGKHMLIAQESYIE